MRDRTRFRRFCKLFALALCAHIFQLAASAPFLLAGQSIEDSKKKFGVIKGKVLGADTGSGLRKVTLTLHSQESRTQALATKTNENGEYEFNQVEPGTYLLEADRNGYLKQLYGAPGPAEFVRPENHPGTIRAAPLIVRAGETLERIDLRLIRGGAVEGQVFDQDNEPLSKVVVELSRIRIVRGKRKLVPSMLAVTDDRGRFRLFDVPPGTYYLSASYRSFGVAGKPVGPGQQKTYPTSYYPGVVELQEAAKIQLSAGAEIGGMNFTLMELSSYTISGRILAGSGRTVSEVRVAALKIPSFGGSESGARADSQGNFTIPDLFPGRYRLVAASSQAEKKRSANAIVDLVNENLAEIVLALGDGAEVAGRISTEGSSMNLDPRQVRVSVLLEEETFGEIRGTTKDDATFHIDSIPEGSGRVKVDLPRGNFYVKSIRMAGRDLIEQVMEFKNGQRLAGVEIVVSSEGGQLDGVARKSETADTAEPKVPVTGAAVLLFSTDSKQRYPKSPVIKLAQTDPQGKFHLEGIGPGEYFICALTDYEFGREDDASYLNELEKHAAQVELRPNESRTVDLVAISAPPLE